MAKVYDNAALVAKDNDGNSATLRGGSKEDWEKIGKGLEQIGNLNEAVLKLKDRVVGAIGSMPEVVDATDAQKGITLLTDDPKADKNAATGVTAATPKAIQTAVAELKEELAQATVELNDANATQKGITLLTDDPKANKDAATGVTAATPKAIQAAVAELQEQIADATVELVDGSDTQKGVVFLTDDPNADKDAATGVTAATPKAIQDALAELQGKIESGEVAGPDGGTGGGSGGGGEEGGGGSGSEGSGQGGEDADSSLGPSGIGIGDGVAPEEVYQSLNLKPLPGTNNPKSFQYGLYEATAPDDSDATHIQTYHAYLKYIPKYYHCFLSTDDETLMNDGQLQELEQYTGLTVAQMKEAQRRGGTSAIALAPASAFENEAEANEHGFILNRGYFDDGKEKPGFFIANTITSFFQSSDAAGNTEIQYYCGAPSFQFEPTYKYAESTRKGLVILYKQSNLTKLFGISATAQGAIDLGRKFTGLNCSSAGMWQVIRMICYANGLYCKDKTECAWYEEGYNARPLGISSNGTSSTVDPTITTSPTISNGQGSVWITNGEYAKTTHSGRVHGITNCAGWGDIAVLGANLGWQSAPITMKLADIASGDSLINNISYEGGHQYVQNSPVTNQWGGAKLNQPFSRSQEHDSTWSQSFLFPMASENVGNPLTQFNNATSSKNFSTTSGGKKKSLVAVGGREQIFRNVNVSIAESWADSTSFDAVFFVGGYPEV